MAEHELRFTSCLRLAPGRYSIEASCSCGVVAYAARTAAGPKSGRQNITKMHERHVTKVTR